MRRLAEVVIVVQCVYLWRRIVKNQDYEAKFVLVENRCGGVGRSGGGGAVALLLGERGEGSGILDRQQCADYRRSGTPSAFWEIAESRLLQDAPVIRVEPDSWGSGAGSAGFSLVLAAVRDYSFKGTCHRNRMSVDCSSGNSGLLQTGEKGRKEKFLIFMQRNATNLHLYSRFRI